jgi:hypothetical protein
MISANHLRLLPSLVLAQFGPLLNSFHATIQGLWEDRGKGSEVPPRQIVVDIRRPPSSASGALVTSITRWVRFPPSWRRERKGEPSGPCAAQARNVQGPGSHFQSKRRKWGRRVRVEHVLDTSTPLFRPMHEGVGVLSVSTTRTWKSFLDFVEDPHTKVNHLTTLSPDRKNPSNRFFPPPSRSSETFSTPVKKNRNSWISDSAAFVRSPTVPKFHSSHPG